MALTLTHQTSFLLTGVFSTLTSQWLYNAGAAAPKSLLTISCTYFGMALAHFVPRRADEEVERSLLEHSRGPPKRRTFLPPAEWRGRILGLALLDITANALLTIGMFLIGSGLYQVVYSSIVAFTALLSTVQVRWPDGASGKTGWSRGLSVRWNPRAVNVWQWVAIAIVTGGLVLPALDAMSLSHNDSHASASFFFGLFIVVLGTFSYALIYVLVEYLVSPKESRPSSSTWSRGSISPDPLDVCTWTGSTASILCVVYLLVVTLPAWDELVASSVRQTGVPWAKIAISYLFYTFSSLLHNVNYYFLLNRTGAVSTGVLQSLRSTLVFLLSAVLFCTTVISVPEPNLGAATAQTGPNQCLTPAKTASCVFVVFGVLVYSWGKARSTSH